MKKIYAYILILAAFTFAMTGCKRMYFDTENIPEPETVVHTSYVNPVIDYSYPDPSVIDGGNGWFYIYCSDESNVNLPIYKSRNLVDWTNTGKTVFTSFSRPSDTARMMVSRSFSAPSTLASTKTVSPST